MSRFRERQLWFPRRNRKLVGQYRETHQALKQLDEWYDTEEECQAAIDALAMNGLLNVGEDIVCQFKARIMLDRIERQRAKLSGK
ncbi:hypothetical protein [Neorhodopirellula lusitana]|uniref:hypothetical protein n=1 Tax=Neorhodopirellula lusitana TaxID=445327 RepID=UPI00384CB21E